MNSKVISAQAAIEKIRPRDSLCVSGFVGTGTPEELIKALENRYLQNKAPFDLTLIFAAAPGDGEHQGVNRLAHSGLLKRIIGGHWALVPKLGALALNNEVEAYNLPLGVISQLYREIAGKRGGLLSKIGMGTFVDPEQDGGRLNRSTWEALVKRVKLDGEDWLHYKPFSIDVAFIRGTTADRKGNISMENEALTLDTLALATATKNSGGLVIAQVERLDGGDNTLNPRHVEIPGILVDHIVVARQKNHRQTWATPFNSAFAGQHKVPLQAAQPMALDERKLIARRASMELPLGGVINLGIGMPEGVSRVAREEGLLGEITLTAEPGVIGGMPQGGLDFGAAINHEALLHQNQQFDFYDGGGLDLAVLGMAQVDARGNVNVSKFGSKLAGAGGFINISQSSSQLVFAGTLTAGVKVAVKNHQLKILQEGRTSKFVAAVEHITFNGDMARQKGQRVLYVTERAVFELGEHGMELIEIAPGIDLEQQVLALIPFPVMVRDVKISDARLYADKTMGLAELLGANIGISTATTVGSDICLSSPDNLSPACNDDDINTPEIPVQKPPPSELNSAAVDLLESGGLDSGLVETATVVSSDAKQDPAVQTDSGARVVEINLGETTGDQVTIATLAS